MPENVYFAYSKPSAIKYDKFGDIESEDILQSRYQEIYAVKENVTTRSAFEIGDKRVYKVTNIYKNGSKDVGYLEDIVDNATKQWCCFYLSSTTLSPSGYQLEPINVGSCTVERYNASGDFIRTDTGINVVSMRPYYYGDAMSANGIASSPVFITNIPIFSDFNTANNYSRYHNASLLSQALNYNKIFNIATNEWDEAPLYTSGKVAFYRQGGAYDLRLVADINTDFVRYSTDGQEWTEKSGVEWYDFISPDAHTVDGFEYKSIFWQTNIPIFGSLTDAENYFTGNLTIKDAENYDSLSSESEKDVALGEVLSGEMGLNQTSLRGAFCSRYAVNNATLTTITNAFFTDDGSILDNIIDGLKLYGQTPMDSIIDLTYYPFDVTEYGTTSAQNYVYFGRYKLDLEASVNKIINLNTIIDCGKISYPINYGDYKDYEPYTECYAYLPYCGLHKINISDYIGKTVGIKYGVDITTGACECFITADGKIIDRYVGQMGVRQFITSMDSATYTANVTNSIVNLTGNTVNTSVGSVGNLVGGSVGGVVSNLVGLGVGSVKGISDFKKATSNVPYHTRGSATSLLNQYDIQYPFFIFVYQKIYPCNDINIVGKPTNQKASVNSFSGFLKCSDVKIQSTATENEITMIENLLKQGIYI